MFKMNFFWQLQPPHVTKISGKRDTHNEVSSNWEKIKSVKSHSVSHNVLLCHTVCLSVSPSTHSFQVTFF